MPSGVFFCCVSCCSALVNALRAVLSDSVTELSLFRASEMALSFRVCCPSRRACCASRGRFGKRKLLYVRSIF
ncbi:hypothetical protein CQX48_19660 [Salmonella enterica]|nr:hypothetical protein [Salmonella enterica]